MSTLTAISFVVFISTQVLGAAIDRSVSFSTGLTSTQYMMDDDTVVYDQVFINDFNGYNPNTGIFTCPIPGVYIFHFHGYSTNKDTVMWLDLKHNDQQVVSVSGYNSHTVGSNTVMLKLRKQDRIQVKSREKIQFALFGLPTQVYSTFTGYLVHEDPNSHQMDSGSAGGIVG
ncbi:C1QL3-like protein [Mya arenaria]|uniref:C1QL3-like protein n=2 Tax=Mya arenaria TaxID=6604 RepID=A0ABY7ELC4_MYAAR|nr:C1QL3-like protein [Mya arenaria]